MADNNKIARPYAQALFDVAKKAGDLSAWSESLGIAQQLFDDGRVAAYLSKPVFSNDQRLDFLTGLFANAGATKLDGSDPHGLNLLKLLLAYGRIALLPENAALFEIFKSEGDNRVEATVTTASPIDKHQKKAFSKALSDRLGRDVSVETKIDENLIGGAVIRAGDVVIDGSVRARLEGLANALTK